MSNPYNSILILGPTGSGKTPLGEYIQKKGLWGQKCFHFDFGENLRQISAGKHSRHFTNEDIKTIKWSLETRALLENEHFHIVEKILLLFIKTNNITENDIIVLNGLPRHTGQAKDMDSILNVKAIIVLLCTPEVIFERIMTNAGGDRTKRLDDAIESIRKKLKIFEERTIPLVDYYSSKKSKIIKLNVQVNAAYLVTQYRQLTHSAASF